VEVEGPAVEHWAAEQAERHGIVDVAHTMDIVGTCASCAAARPAGRN
jgi:Fur family ferric uptake transcriptional regulator